MHEQDFSFPGGSNVAERLDQSLSTSSPVLGVYIPVHVVLPVVLSSEKRHKIGIVFRTDRSTERVPEQEDLTRFPAVRGNYVTDAVIRSAHLILCLRKGNLPEIRMGIAVVSDRMSLLHDSPHNWLVPVGHLLSYKKERSSHSDGLERARKRFRESPRTIVHRDENSVFRGFYGLYDGRRTLVPGRAGTESQGGWLGRIGDRCAGSIRIAFAQIRRKIISEFEIFRTGKKWLPYGPSGSNRFAIGPFGRIYGKIRDRICRT